MNADNRGLYAADILIHKNPRKEVSTVEQRSVVLDESDLSDLSGLCRSEILPDIELLTRGGAYLCSPRKKREKSHEY